MNFNETIDCIYKMTQSGIKIWVEKDRLHVTTPRGIQLSQIEKDLIKNNKGIFVDVLNRNKVFSEKYSCLILKNEEEKSVLSFGQERLYFIHRYEEGTNVYNIPLIFRFKTNGVFNLNAFEKSIQGIIARHEIFRTLIKEDLDGTLYQSVTKKIELSDIFRHTQVSTQAQLDEAIGKEVAYVFDLNNHYPIRIQLLEFGEEIYVSFVIHHIAFDGWSVDLFIKEFESFYSHYAENRPLDLPELPVQYKDFALWQRSYFHADRLKEQFKYWSETLEGYENIGLLPDRPRPKQFQYEGRDLSFSIDEAQSAALRELAKQQNVTVNSILLAAYFLMLRAYSHQDDLIVGTPLLNRHYAQVENLMGFFVNSLPLRVQININDRITDYIQKISKKTIEAQLHQDLPFEKLVEELHVPKDPSLHPIFQVMFAVQSFGNEQGKGGGRLLEKYEPQGEFYNIAKFDLSTFIDDSEREIKGVFNFATKIFNSSTVEGFLKTFLKIVRQFAQMILKPTMSEEVRIADLTYLEDDEYSKIVIEWNNTGKKDFQDKTVNQLFESQVIQSPHAVAVICGDEKLTYLDLSRKVDQIAGCLYHIYKLKEEDLVLLMLERNINYLAVMLAIFKVGAAFVPIDTTMPRDRILSIIEECRAKLVITDEINNRLTQEYYTYFSDLFLIDNIPQQMFDPIKCIPNDKAAAYVIYTSGSTGKPKGAVIEYEGMVNHLISKIEAFSMTHQDVMAQIASQSFDVSIWQFLAALFVGGRVVIFKGESAWNPEPLLKICFDEKVTILETVPSHMYPILSEIASEADRGIQSFSPLRWLILNGESLPLAMCDRWFEFYPHIAIMNAYGATEVSDDVCHYPISKSLCGSIELSNGIMPVGGLIRNSTMYVLDSCYHPLPVRAVGEIYMGGIGVGRGYYKRPDLTAERFVHNPFNDGVPHDGFNPRHHLRIYKTGDLGRYLPDGSIEFCGRVDFQVKIRGQRVELEEIEKAIEHLRQIRQAVVVARKKSSEESRNDDKYLVAYYISDAVQDPERLIRELSIKLPEHMVPKIFMHLEAFPLTVSGKLDRKSLPEPIFYESKTYDAPKTEIEIQLAKIWAEVLGIESHRVGVDDDFFRLGGDSIISIQLVNRMRQRLGVNINIKDVFAYRTIGALARHVGDFEVSKSTKDDGENLGENLGEQGELSGPFSLLPIQEWFFNQKFPKSNHWNQAFLVKVPPLCLDKLKSSLKGLLSHHDALRLRFKRSSDEKNVPTIQNYQSLEESFSSENILEILDISQLKNDELQKILTDGQSHFDCENGPLFKFYYLHGYPEGEARLFFAFHHLIVDAVSWRILIEDLKSLYEGKALSLKTSSYRQWVAKMNRYCSEYPQEKGFWQDLQSDYEDGPYDAAKALDAADQMERETFVISRIQTEKLLRQCHAVFHTSIADVLLSALAYTLQDLTSLASNYVLLEGHGREDVFQEIDLTRGVGWFTSLYPIRIDAKNEIGLTVSSMKEKLKAIPNKGLGYGAHIGYKNPGNLPKVVFNYLGQFNEAGQKNEKLWEIIWEDAGSTIDPANISPSLLTINSLIGDGKFQFEVNSRLDKYSPASIAEKFIHHLSEIVDCLCMSSRCYLTPSDVESVVSQEYLDKIQVKSEVEDIYLANSLQQGFVYRHLNSNPENDAYCVQHIWQYNDSLRVDDYKKAWSIAQERFDVLRLRLAWEEEIVQIVDKKAKLDWRFIDISSEKEKFAQDQLIEEIQIKDRKEKFQLGETPLFRITLIKCQEALYTMIFSNHHAILDGWSNPILLKFVHDTYLELKRGEIPKIARDKTYGDAQKYLQAHHQESMLYWKERLSKVEEAHYVLPRLNPAFNFSRSHTSLSSSQNSLKIEGVLYEGIKRLSKAQGFTLNAILQYIWHRILHVYTRLDTTIVGSVVSGRNLPVDGVEGSVGLFINTLPLIIDHSRFGKTLLDCISNIQTAIGEINTYSHVHLSHLQKNGEQLFDTIFIYENYPVPVVDPRREAVSATFLNAVEKLDYPLAIMAYDTGNQIELIWKYDEDYVSPLFVQCWIKAFKQISGEVVHNFAADPESLGYLSQGEHEPLVAPLSSGEPQFSKDKTIHELFEAQVDKQPHAIALVCGKRQLSYQELNQKSNQLAYHLRELASLAPDDCVALCLERSEMLIVSILAILKAGAAYVPIDPNYPDLRISQMINETKARIIITDQADRMCGLCSDSLRPIVDLKKLDEQIQSFPKNNLPADATNVERCNLAYVIYTSGTTGSPKGVMIEHRSFIATLDAFKIRYFPEAGHLNTFSLTSAMFDIFGLEYGLPLFTGGTITIGLNAIIDRLDCRDFQFIQMTPHLCEVNLDQLENTQNTLLLVGGEALPKNLLNRIIDKQINLINAYGPTETTIWSTTMPYFFNRREKKPNADRFVKIGSPLDHETAYVLDDHLKPLPLLAIGELYIGGTGLARGYINKPEETKEKFLPDPFRKNSRIYKTGDWVRRHPDGCLEYVGRIDQQIKLRGQRIELSEIENAVNQYRGIEQSAVVLKQDPKDQLSLICYYQTGDGKPKTEEEIKLFLFKIIPGYMVPTIYMHLDKFPLNSNGKLDRKELPEPAFLSDYRNFQGARNPLESQVKKIWEEILGLQDQMIDIRDDFFKLGGNSILAIKLISKINKQYFTNLKLADIFVHNTIESFVPRIDKLKEGPQIILKLNNTEFKPKMFMIHPGGGGCEVYLPLAKKLESQFSCYGVDYYNLYHDEKIGSVKEIALYYLSEIEKIWEETDREAIHLLGWSLGGQIALEIAYQLEQTGKKNIQLYVLDTILNDEYLETLGSYEDLEKRKELFANYAKGLGYNQEYVDKVRANIHMESILGMQKISGNLDAARIVLFKAMMEDKTLSEVMSRHHEINHYVEQLKFNNIDKVIEHREKLVLYEVPNTDHGSILEQLEFLVPRIASHEG